MEMTEPFEKAAHDIENRVLQRLESVATRLAHLNEHLATYIRANPGRCLFGAVAAGYVVGRIARRK